MPKLRKPIKKAQEFSQHDFLVEGAFFDIDLWSLIESDAPY
jgi:hypothetical protein